MSSPVPDSTVSAIEKGSHADGFFHTTELCSSVMLPSGLPHGAGIDCDAGDGNLYRNAYGIGLGTHERGLMALRVVVIGTGFGQHVVAPAYAAIGCDVSVVSPRDDDALRAAITAPSDLISVHSPPFLHREHVRMAIENGRNILCDKPFGTDAQQAYDMLNLAKDAGVLHFLNFEFRCEPLRAKLKELVDDGAIGTPVHANWTSFTSMGRKLRHRWLFEEHQGGWIGANGSHAIDTLRWLFGEITDASAHRRTDVTHRRDRDKTSDVMHASTAEDSFTANFHMASGFTAVLDTSFVSSVTVPSVLTVFGDAGVIQATDASDLVVIRPGEEPERHSFAMDPLDPHQLGLGRWLGKVCAAVADGHQIAPNFADGAACADVMDALRSSPSATQTTTPLVN